MNNIEQIASEILSIDSDVSAVSIRLQRENGEIANTMNKAQSTFGDQQAGQQLVNTLYRILQNVNNADGSLNIVRQEMRDYIQMLQK